MLSIIVKLKCRYICSSYCSRPVFGSKDHMMLFNVKCSRNSTCVVIYSFAHFELTSKFCEFCLVIYFQHVTIHDLMLFVMNMRRKMVREIRREDLTSEFCMSSTNECLKEPRLMILLGVRMSE